MGIATGGATGQQPVIVDGVRTPFAAAGGTLRELSAIDLGRLAVTELLARTDLDPAAVDEVLVGCSSVPPNAPDLARRIAVLSGIGPRATGAQVQRGAASGMEAVAQACRAVASGAAESIIACGAESASRDPLRSGAGLGSALRAARRQPTRFRGMRALVRLRAPDLTLGDAAAGGPEDPVTELRPIEIAERLARRYAISRLAQDELALLSHRRAVAAAARLAEEIVAVYVPPTFTETLLADPEPDAQLTLEALSSRPALLGPRHGTVTDGNAAAAADGACALLVLSQDRARSGGYRPLGKVRAAAWAAVEPSCAGLGVVAAAGVALERAQVGLSEIDLIELDESSAAEVIAGEIAFASAGFAREQLGRPGPVGGIDRSRLNVNGGSLALGRAAGAGGARLVLSLLKEMRRRQASLGLAATCAGGGQAVALVLEVV